MDTHDPVNNSPQGSSVPDALQLAPNIQQPNITQPSSEPSGPVSEEMKQILFKMWSLMKDSTNVDLDIPQINDDLMNQMQLMYNYIRNNKITKTNLDELQEARKSMEHQLNVLQKQSQNKLQEYTKRIEVLTTESESKNSNIQSLHKSLQENFAKIEAEKNAALLKLQRRETELNELQEKFNMIKNAQCQDVPSIDAERTNTLNSNIKKNNTKIKQLTRELQIKIAELVAA